MAEPHDRKPIPLTIEQQIEHLKQEGRSLLELCSEEEAADYLRDKCNFFKLASYRKLFSNTREAARRPLRRPRLRPAAPAAALDQSCATPCSA